MTSFLIDMPFMANACSTYSLKSTPFTAGNVSRAKNDEAGEQERREKLLH